MSKKKVLVFATGTATGGASGAENLIQRSKIDDLGVEIVAIVSNHPHGGAYRVAQKNSVPFHHFSSGTWSAAEYQQIFRRFPHDIVALSGWLKPVRGNDRTRTINIHPARLPRFGGHGMFGDNIHRAVLDAFKKGQVRYSAVSMHFVPDYDEAEYDRGPVFFEYWVPIEDGDTPESLKRRVNIAEHHFQPYITSLVANGHIRWDIGNNKVIVPPCYPFLPKK